MVEPARNEVRLARIGTKGSVAEISTKSLETNDIALVAGYLMVNPVITSNPPVRGPLPSRRKS